MSLTQIIYSSKPFGFTASVLDDILTVSRTRNARDDITGTLICRGDLYMQLIEGPDAAIAATYERIIADDRHLEVDLLVSRPVSTRWSRLARLNRQVWPKYWAYSNGWRRRDECFAG